MTWGQVKTFAYGTVVVVLDALLGWAIDACHRQSRRGR